MPTSPKRLASLAATCMICAAPAAVALTNTAAAATAKQPTRSAGTSFVASTAIGGVQISVSRDNRSVRKALFAYEMKCSDGEKFYDYDLFDPIRIGADRSFKYHYDSPAEPSTAVPGTTYTYSQSISGTMNKARTKIVGTARSTMTGTTAAGVAYTCDTGPIKFTAYD
jgi:hypothetical protein